MKDSWLRARAEIENVRRQGQADVAKAHKYAVEKFAEDLVAVKDALEQTVSADAAVSIDTLKAGAELTLKSLNAAFARAQIREIRQLIKSFAGEHTVILSTHILAEVTMTCNRVLIINEGKIAADETMERLRARGERTQRIAVRLARPPADPEGALRAVPGVVSVTRETAPDGSFVVETDAARDAREEIARLAVTQGWGLLEMRAITLSLEDIFIRIIRGEEAAA